MHQGRSIAESVTQKILVIDGDLQTLDMVRTALTSEGYQVLSARDGESGLRLAEREGPDLVILGLALPDMDGLEACRRLRQISTVPILFLSTTDDEATVIAGLELGADDHVTKPFRVGELMARVRALLRRAIGFKRKEEAILHFGDLVINLSRHEVHKSGALIKLSPREFRVLHCLASQPNMLLTRQAILDKAWGYDYMGDPRVVDVVIHRLRAKIEDDPSAPRLIETVWGFGYKFSWPGR